MFAIAGLAVIALAACGGTEETEAGANNELPVDELPVDELPVDEIGEPMEPGTYQPVAAMDDMVDPQPAPIDEVIVGGDGQSITVRYQNGYEPCSGARVKVIEDDLTIEILLETGLHPNVAAMSCLAGTTGYEQTLILDSPIGEREVMWTQASPAESEQSAGQAENQPDNESDEDVIDAFIGLDLDEAEAKAEAQGRAFRVAELDGEPMMLTADVVTTRVNVTVENGIVQSGYLG